MPNLANVTAPTLIDWVAVVRRHKNNLDLLEKYLSTALKARVKHWPAEGTYFIGNQEPVHQERISAEKCRELLTPELLEQVTVGSDFAVTRFAEKAGLNESIERKLLAEALA
jgi:hypothetical protein